MTLYFIHNMFHLMALFSILGFLFLFSFAEFFFSGIMILHFIIIIDQGINRINQLAAMEWLPMDRNAKMMIEAIGIINRMIAIDIHNMIGIKYFCLFKTNCFISLLCFDLIRL